MSSNRSFSSETSNRYAKAIFELAKENNELDSIEKNFRNILELYESNQDFKYFIKNPTHTSTSQIELINKISEKMEFSKNLKNFLSVLVKKKRIFFLKKIILSFLKLSSIKRGELNAKLISSKDLSSKELKNVSSELSKTTGSEISFDYQVDKDLIGGFKMQIGSLMIDTSIKNKLKKYKQIMLEN
jgi:F-type H+-transporting ATPase subunit delta|tara:strand:- start:321 stop:878 length:558 start_codon:yes stop_codon:yes gene_type:complete